MRGRVLGTECLPEPLTERPSPRTRRRLPLAGPNLLTGAAFGLALLATTLPWSRFGVGSGMFGAWGRTSTWALLAALATLIGATAWVARQVLGDERPAFDVALAILGAIVALASALAIWHPPAFTRVWVGPWIAALAGLVACAASTAGLRRARAARLVRV